MLQALFGLRRGRGFGRLSAKHAAIADPVQPRRPNRYYETLTRFECAVIHPTGSQIGGARLPTVVRRPWFTVWSTVGAPGTTVAPPVRAESSRG